MWAALGGLTAYLAFGTRSVGLVLIPAVFLTELLRSRRIGAATIVSGGVFAAGVGAQMLLLRLDGSYADQLTADPMVFARVAWSLIGAMGLFFENGYSSGACHVVYLALLIPAVVGFVTRLRSKPTVYEPFAVLSLALLILWPFAEWQRRYLLPLLPLFVLYSCEGLVRLGQMVSARAVLPAAGVLGAAVLLSYATWYTRLEFGPFRQGVTTPEAAALFRFIRDKTHPDDVILFQKPRALALYTGRRSSGHRPGASDEHLWSYLRQIDASHVVVTPQLPGSWKVLAPFVKRNADRLDPVYRSEAFSVYRIRLEAVAQN